jgi:hypothetical protein
VCNKLINGTNVIKCSLHFEELCNSTEIQTPHRCQKCLLDHTDELLDRGCTRHDIHVVKEDGCDVLFAGTDCVEGFYKVQTVLKGILLSCTPLVYSSHAILSYIPLMHSSRTLLLIHSSRTLLSYTRHVAIRPRP